MKPVLPDGFLIADPFQKGMEKEYFDLRWRVLREPWLQPRGTEKDEQEETSFHRMVHTREGDVVACGRLQLNSPREGQIRYMAVDPRFRNLRLGAAIIQELEMLATDAGAVQMVLQARENAVEFYISCGYSVVAKTFLLYNEIQHFLMTKRLG
ncbi:MAG: GNAT family N-acetyltransferase [Bacteroidia bacterium]